jgi:aminopeptidase N
MTLAITIDNDWLAVSNEKEVRHEEVEEGRAVIDRFGINWFLNFYENQEQVAVYEFAQTPKISTYLYAICAGPYLKFEDFDPAYPPQRVFVRESLVENLRHELLTGITKTTLTLYENTYGHKFPFSKVDHVMCPDYKYGAMENVGCITYSDGIMCS